MKGNKYKDNREPNKELVIARFFSRQFFQSIYTKFINLQGTISYSLEKNPVAKRNQIMKYPTISLHSIEKESLYCNFITKMYLYEREKEKKEESCTTHS